MCCARKLCAPARNPRLLRNLRASLRRQYFGTLRPPNLPGPLLVLILIVAHAHTSDAWHKSNMLDSTPACQAYWSYAKHGSHSGTPQLPLAAGASRAFHCAASAYRDTAGSASEVYGN